MKMLLIRCRLLPRRYYQQHQHQHQHRLLFCSFSSWSSPLSRSTRQTTTAKPVPCRYFRQRTYPSDASSPVVKFACGAIARHRFGSVGISSQRGFTTSETTTTTSTTTTTLGGSSHLPPSCSSINLGKVLIANRGEIACRVARTCRRLGIPTVAVYSVADGPASLHARAADEAVLIGSGPAASDSYLMVDDVLAAAAATGAAAVHPGYGFLSENAAFCRAVRDAGMVFVGPPATAMLAMASKSKSKAIMDAAGVPTTPGYYHDHDDGNDSDRDYQDAEFLLDRAVNHVGFPLLIKAVMGGGGKGMRLVFDESEFLSALESCRRESLASFGDDAVLLERYLVKPRHVEVQVIADEHGNVVHLHERDCSLQRRHQKIIEEAPAPDLSAGVRNTLGEMGIRAAKAVGYVNAGTVEFLVDTDAATRQDDDDDGSHPLFYFCEMNTRLQVEHPVTELITGIDLVEWQLRVAAGEALPVTDQREIPCTGHALEARVYAENPARGFLPATGTLWHCRLPGEAKPNAGSNVETGVRVDTAVQEGDNISVYYDPMISKLIVHGDDRLRAVDKLVAALEEYQIAGVPTNIDFLIKCAKHPTFRQPGATNTGFLEDYADDVRIIEEGQDGAGAVAVPPPPVAQAIGALAVFLHLEHRVVEEHVSVDQDHRSLDPLQPSQPVQPWSSKSGSWRMGGQQGRARRTLHVVSGSGGNRTAVSMLECISNRDGSFDVVIVDPANVSSSSGEDDEEEDDDGGGSSTSIHVRGSLDRHGNMEVIVNKTKRVRLTAAMKTVGERNEIQVRMWPQRCSRHLVDENSGHVWELNVLHPLVPQESADSASSAAGTAAGQSGVVTAPMPGKIRRVLVKPGDDVCDGDVVVVLEAMKMEHAVPASRTGVIESVSYRADDIVQDGDVLLVVAAAPPPKEGGNNNEDERNGRDDC